MKKNWVLSNNEKFLFSETLSDVTFVFEEDKLLHAHSHHLTFASEVFKNQIFGSMHGRIEIKDATYEAFRTFIRFIYTGELQLSLENLFELAYLGKKYMIAKVTALAKDFFMRNVLYGNIERNIERFWALFRPKEIEYFDDVAKSCLARPMRVFETRTPSLITSEQFLRMDQDVVGELVRNEQLAIKEFDLYKAVLRWAEHQCKGDRLQLRKIVEPFIHSLRLPTLSSSDLTTVLLQSANNDLLSLEEKQSLLSHYAGMHDVSMPFIKMPRKNSLDVLVTDPAAGYSEMYSSTPTSTTFVPQAAYRLVGVTCQINSEEKHAQVSFELVKINEETEMEESVWNSKMSKLSQDVGKDFVFCPVLYQLLPHTKYVMRATPDPGVSIRLFRGSIKKNVRNCLLIHRKRKQYGSFSFSLLPA